MKQQNIFALMMLSLTAVGAGSQALNREITVDREIVPVEAEARPLPLTPEIVLPALQRVSLSPAEKAVAIPVTPSLSLLDPARRVDPNAPLNARGYVAGGIGAPVLNFDLSAGYTFVATESTRLGAMMQWNSNVYERCDSWWRTHASTLGVGGNTRFGSGALLEYGASWAFNRFNMPGAMTYFWQTANRADVNAAWHSQTGGMTYNLRADYKYFGYANSPLAQAEAVKQNGGGIGGDAWLPVSDNSQIGLKADVVLLRSNVGGTSGVVSLTPQWRLMSEKWIVKAGPRIDITINGDKAFHVAPDVELAWTPTAFFGLKLNAGGGERLNFTGDLAQAAQRQSPYMTYGMTHMPITAAAGITLGPWRRTWVRLFADWAKANSTLMPMIGTDGIMAWTHTNLSGAVIGGEVGVKYASLLELTAGYSVAAGHYYLWLDDARHVADVRLTVRPSARLRLSGGYQLRACRSIATLAGNARLKNESLLTVNASYEVTRRFCLWADVRNLLNRSSRHIDLTPEQGIGVMIGASYLF